MSTTPQFLALGLAFSINRAQSISRSMSSSSAVVRIASYNILSDSLCKSVQPNFPLLTIILSADEQWQLILSFKSLPYLCYTILHGPHFLSFVHRQSHFIHSDKADLDNAARFERVKTQLLVEMQRGSIICLQEVSRKWSAQLLPIFEQHGYSVAAAPYGNPFNG